MTYDQNFQKCAYRNAICSHSCILNIVLLLISLYINNTNYYHSCLYLMRMNRGRFMTHYSSVLLISLIFNMTGIFNQDETRFNSTEFKQNAVIFQRIEWKKPKIKSCSHLVELQVPQWMNTSIIALRLRIQILPLELG